MAAGTALTAAPVAAAWLWLGRPPLPLNAVLVLLASGIVELLYFIVLSHAYERGEISVVYPIARGTAPLLAVLSGLLLLGERVGPLQLAGVGLLLAGLWAVRRPTASREAVLPALLVGVTIATYTSIDRVGVRLGPAWLYAWVLNLWVAGLLWAWIAAHRARYTTGPPAPGWRLSGLVGAFMWGSYFLVLLALSIAPLVLVAPLREVSIVAVSIWGVWRFRERERTAARLAGALAVVAGIVLIAL